MSSADASRPGQPSQTPPPAAGVRLEWAAVPLSVRQAVESWLGSPVVRADTQLSGFSPGVAARLLTADNRRIFVKAISADPNPTSIMFHRREARVTSLLPSGVPSPRLLWSYDEDEWVVMLFEDVEGRHPAQPWAADELSRVVDAMTTMSEALTPSPLSPDVVSTVGELIASVWLGWQRLEQNPLPTLDDWSARHLPTLVQFELSAPQAAAGSTLLHCDVRADNILLTADQVWFVDWPQAHTGAPWLDVVFFAPSVTMQGGPPPEAVAALHPAFRSADPDAVTAVIAAVAGLFTHRSLQPSPPGLPTLRAFQAAQAVIAREWLARRTGLS